MGKYDELFKKHACSNDNDIDIDIDNDNENDNDNDNELKNKNVNVIRTFNSGNVHARVWNRTEADSEVDNDSRAGGGGGGAAGDLPIGGDGGNA